MEKALVERQVVESGVLPPLQDPVHPGMRLVSRIALFSATLLALLISLVFIAGNRIVLDFELDAEAEFSVGQLLVSIDERKASAIEPGAEISILLESEVRLSATVSSVGIPDKGKVLLMVLPDFGSYTLEEAGVFEVSLIVQQPLKDLIISKLSL